VAGTDRGQVGRRRRARGRTAKNITKLAAQVILQIGKPRVHLATRPLLPEHDGATRIVAYDVERVLADINADHGDAAPNLWVHALDNFILTSPASSNYPVWTVTLARPWARP
jgi:hypothetical protein